MRITKRDIKDLFIKCEYAYDKCWNTLLDLKISYRKDKEFIENLIMFQEILSNPLFELQELRNKITKWEKELITKKKHYKSSWFNKQMRCLSHYKISIDQLRNVGKGIGDAFVYFFYRNDLHLLEKQFRHKRIDSTLGETGLKGEKYFVRSFKHIDGKLTIYHGICNILRYGDFSFYDLQSHKIDSIGELKTKYVEAGKYELNLSIIMTSPGEKGENNSLTEISNLSIPVAARLETQINKIVNILNPENETTTINSRIVGESYERELQKLYDMSKINRTNYLQVSSGLMFIGVRLSKASLYTTMFKRKLPRLTSLIGAEAADRVKDLLKTGSKDNNIILGSLHYSNKYMDKNRSGTAPLFWYPLSSELLKNLYFSNFIVFTAFNPAHIIHNLKEKGYNVKSKYNNAADIPGKAQIQYFDSIIALITSHLQTEQSVLTMIEAAFDIQLKKNQYGSLKLKPYINLSAIFGLNLKDITC